MSRLTLFALYLILTPLAGVAEQPKYADHSQLMIYQNPQNVTQKITDVDGWKIRRQHILAGMQEAMGALPSREKLPPFDVKILKTERGNGFTRHTLTFRADHDRIPAYLYLPLSRKADEKRPAILALHPTGTLGKGIVAGESERANREYGMELAQRGYVVICPDYPSFGDYPYDFSKDDYISGTMKGIFNHMRCVDYLCSLKEVDPERIGVIGHSLGGHNAMFVSAFDERLKVTVSSCGWTPFHDYYGGKIAGWTSDRYMPLLKTKYKLDPDLVPFDFYEIAATLAPRAFFSSSPLHDSNFDVKGVKKAEPIVREVFKLHGVPENLKIIYPNCEHDFPVPTRKEVYAFLDQHLKFTPVAGQDFSAELPRIPAHEPVDALSTFKVLPGFRLEQIAAEPLINDPVAVCFDAAGRLYAAEMRGYSEQGSENLGQIRLLEDTDSDGRFDKSHLFATGLSWPTAILCFDGGVFVGAAPDIFYLKDTNGDGKADVNQKVFTGFSRGNVQGLINCFRWGLDNRIHGATSSSGGTVKTVGKPDMPALNLRGRDFSFDPRKLDLRPESGGAQHGLCFDSWGRKYVCSNSDHIQYVQFEDRYVARNPLVAPPRVRVSIASDGPQAEVYRISPVEPWRLVRTRLRKAGLVRGPVEGGGRAAGYFTGATGVTIYTGDAWADEYAGLAVIGDVGSNIVHRKQIKRDGLKVVANRMDEKREFVASTDIWFRPVQFANAPDGTLHILDMYREVIEHPLSLPPEIKKHLDLTHGRARGRLYRILPDQYTARKSPNLSSLPVKEVVALLAHPNGWHRETAGRVLFERQDGTAVPDLKALLRTSENPHGRMCALYALSGLNSLTAQDVLAALADEDPQVRRHALRLSETLAVKSPLIHSRLLELVNDPDLEVQFQLALTLGEFPGAGQADALVNLAKRHASEPLFQFAILNSLYRNAGEVAASLVADEKFRSSASGKQFLSALVTMIGRRANQNEVAVLMQAISQAEAGVAQTFLPVLTAALQKSGSPLAKSVGGEFTAKLLKEARENSIRQELAVAERVSAVALLKLGSLENDRQLLVKLLDPAQPQEVQEAAVQTLGSFSDAQVAPLLLKSWPRFTPRIRAVVVETLLSRKPWQQAILQAILDDELPASELPRGSFSLLRKNPDTTVRTLAEAVEKKYPQPNRDKIVKAYQTSLELTGDIANGRKLFQKTCAACHKVENFGIEIGPNLLAMKNRGPEAILLNVMDPNREVNPQYLSYVVVDISGKSYTGMITAENATSLTLRRGEKKADITILRADIEMIRNTGLSLMPEGLEKTITPQHLADLIAYLSSLK